MIGVFGGTFDPIHFGHLRAALEVQQQLDLEKVLLIPCGEPPHREVPLASAEHRWNMTRLAAAEYSYFEADDREIRRDGPSYMVDTLASLESMRGDDLPCLILGMDAFAGLAGWHQWHRLPELAHLVVMTRPGAEPDLNDELNDFIRPLRVGSPNQLRGAAHGRVWMAQVSALDISATMIRRCFEQGTSARFLLPRSICDYVEENRLYR